MISMLIIQSVWDIRYRQIPIVVTAVSAMIGLTLSLWFGREIWNMVLGVLPGVICLAMGWMTREAIGYGDGFVLCAMGLYLELEQILWIIMMAGFLTAVVAIVCLITGRKKGRDTLPFVPFLLVAACILCIRQGGGFYDY